MNISARLRYLLKAIFELGPRQVLLYAGYQIGLRSGYYRLRSPVLPLGDEQAFPLNTELIELPHPEEIRSVIGSEGLETWEAAAEEVISGSVKIFGEVTVPLALAPSYPTWHWSAYELGAPLQGVSDIKYLWEPARFGWAYPLSCAYHLLGDERYAEAFWHFAETFIQANPPNLGPHWSSAQEVALRLITLVWAFQVFSHSPHTTPSRSELFSRAVAAHAERLPLTLNYARAQNNNHLLSEAAGLLTAGLALPEHPGASRWRKLGMRWLNRGYADQIAPDGSYVQHSVNYHRLMLQLAVWVESLLAHQPAMGRETLTPQVRDRLGSAARWLLRLLDSETGGVPNLGPNDGAYLQPLSVLPFRDYRPVLQSAAFAFLSKPVFPPGVWDELSLWLGLPQPDRRPDRLVQTCAARNPIQAPHRLDNGESWAYLRAAHFDSRPGHADQLHLDLWWRGLNLAQDAGTYSYNAPPPWDNPLVHTSVHNTLNVDGADQMTRAGRFLWLDWAQAELFANEKAEDGSWKRLHAQHDGFREIGVLHRREVTAYRSGRWEVIDNLHPASSYRMTGEDSGQAHILRLHWLLPDLEWELETRETELDCRLRSPFGWVSLQIALNSVPDAEQAVQLFKCRIVRAGELVYGTDGVSPSWGWFSPTYGVKEPALSVAVTTSGRLPLSIQSIWQLPKE